jgi:hypothetical protein
VYCDATNSDVNGSADMLTVEEGGRFKERTTRLPHNVEIFVQIKDCFLLISFCNGRIAAGVVDTHFFEVNAAS